MDPRPYHFDYRRPRLSNPTLYLIFNPVNLLIFTTASIRSLRRKFHLKGRIQIQIQIMIITPKCILLIN